MIKHIFCDLDGTLYHGKISEEDRVAIEDIEKTGVVFHVATGRIFKQAHQMVSSSFDLNGYYICENGAFIHDKEGKLILKSTIDDGLVKKVISRLDLGESSIYFKYDGKMVVIEEAKVFSKYTNDYVLDPKFLSRDTFNGLVGNIGIASEDIEELGRIELNLKSEFDEVLDIYFSSPNTLNIVQRGVSKREGIKHICKILDVSFDEIATIGDSPNDINMLENMKYSFAMDDARDEVKKVASYIQKSVAEVISMIKEINKDFK